MLFVLTLVVIGITNKTGIISDDIVLNRYVMQLLQQQKIYKYKTYRELEHGFGEFSWITAHQGSHTSRGSEILMLFSFKFYVLSIFRNCSPPPLSLTTPKSASLVFFS